jgi:hypothetical protein
MGEHAPLRGTLAARRSTTDAGGGRHPSPAMYAELLASFCAGAAVSYVSTRGAARDAVAEIVADQRWRALVDAAGYAEQPAGVGARVARRVERELAREAQREPGAGSQRWSGEAPSSGEPARAARTTTRRFGLTLRVRA